MSGMGVCCSQVKTRKQGYKSARKTKNKEAAKGDEE